MIWENYLFRLHFTARVEKQKKRKIKAKMLQCFEQKRENMLRDKNNSSTEGEI